MLDGVGEEFERDGDAGRGDVDPIDRAIERRVGVDVAALVLHGLRELARAALFRALEKHVLEQV